MDPILTRLSVCITLASHSRLGRGWHGDKTFCPDAKLYLPLSGSGFVQYGGVRYELQAGSIYLIPPGVVLDYGLDVSMDILWAHVRLRVMDVVNLSDYVSLVPMVSVELDAVAPRMERMLTCWHSTTHAEQMEAQGLVLQLIALFMSHEQTDEEHASRRITLQRLQPVFAYMEKQQGRAIRIEELADILHLETSHFASLFSRAVGTPPAKYMLRRRIEQARVLLRSTEATVGELAAELGFSDAFHFSRTFKRLMGMSPQVFRHMKPEEYMP